MIMPQTKRTRTIARGGARARAPARITCAHVRNSIQPVWCQHVGCAHVCAHGVQSNIGPDDATLCPASGCVDKSAHMCARVETMKNTAFGGFRVFGATGCVRGARLKISATPRAGGMNYAPARVIQNGFV